jgi:homoserine O-acetyltransferase
MLTPAFAGELFGQGQPLDAKKYFIIIPDSLGHGNSTRPSDGLRTKFPRYNYDDMVEAQHRLLTEGLGIKRVRLIIGNSMGGMQTWMWGEKYPEFADALAPMASQPTAMAARNWMLRRFMIETIRRDPEYANGDYKTQPKSMQVAAQFYATATSGGTLAYQKLAPTGAQADKLVDERLAAPFTADANDYIYAWESSKDYDPASNLEKIQAQVLCINAADDERNPPETRVTEAALKRIKNAQLLLIPASEETRGHGTTAQARFYTKELRAFLDAVPKRAM